MTRISYVEEWFTIDDIVIEDDIFSNDLYEYRIITRDDEIDNLFDYISKSKNFTEKSKMVSDFRTLMDMNDDYILSSININDYIDSNRSSYNFHCNRLLEINNNYLEGLIK